MQPKMRQNQLTREECEALLDRITFGTVSTNGADGYPYGAPVNIVRIGDRIFFHGRDMGEKVDNIARDPRVCVTVVDEGDFEDMGEDACDSTAVYESVIIRGNAVAIKDEEEKGKVLRALVEKLTPSKASHTMNGKRVLPTAIFAVSIANMTGKYHRPRPGNPIMPRHPQ